MLFMVTWQAMSINVENDPVEITQPNGQIIGCFITGDEYFHRLHDAAGYVICLEQDGYYYYAKAFENEKWVASSFKVGSVNPATTGLKPWLTPSADYLRAVHPQEKSVNMVENKAMTNGKSTALMILIKFSDQSDFTPAYLDDLDSTLSAVTEPSVYNYYKEVSYNHLFLNGYILRVTYTDSNPRSYYLPYNATTNPNGYADSEKNTRRSALLQNAVNYVKDKFPADIKPDMNADGKIDFLSFVIKGNAGAWGDLLWPHATSGSFNNVKINGLGIGKYIFMTENKTNRTTFTHEFFHNMGAPDVYRYTNTDIDPAPQMFAEASHPNAYYKWKFSDGTWVKEIPTITASGVYTLYPLAITDNFGTKKCAYKIMSPYDPAEFFVIEYRQKTSETYDNVSKSGAFVYRINPAKNGNGSGPPDEIYVYRNGGTYLHNGDKTSIYVGKGLDIESVSDDSDPSCYLSNGFRGGLNIDSVGVAGDSIQIRVNIQPKNSIMGGGIYTIRNANGGNIIGADGIAAKCNTAAIDSATEWMPDYIGSGLWRIINLKSGNALSIPGNSTASGVPCTVEGYSGGAGQKWYLFSATDGYTRFVSSANKNLILTNANGVLTTLTYSTNNNMKWTFERRKNTFLPDIQYVIQSKTTGKSLYFGAGKLNQISFNSTSSAQKFLFESAGDDDIKIKSVASGTYLNYNGSTFELSTIAKLWHLTHNADGSLNIADKTTGKALAVDFANQSSLGGVMAVDANDSDITQKFLFVNVTNYKTTYVTPEYPPVTIDDLRKDLYVYLPFENSLDNAVNSDEYELAVTPTGTPTYVAGQVKQSLSMNGSTDFLTIATEDALSDFNPATQSFTIALWVKNMQPASDQTERIFVQQANDAAARTGRSIFYITPKNDAYGSYLGGVSYVSPAGTYTSGLGKWTHVTLVADLEKQTISYLVNGKLENTTPISKAVESCSGNLLIGCTKELAASTRKWLGQIDELYIYKRALNPAEVAALKDNKYNTLADGIASQRVQQLSVWPNPANNRLYLSARTNQLVQVTDISGKLVAGAKYNSAGIDISNLANGIYMVKTATNNGLFVAKVLINR